MKLENRIRLLCTKPLRGGLNINDQFSIVVFKNEESTVRNKYQSLGYKVSEIAL